MADRRRSRLAGCLSRPRTLLVAGALLIAAALAHAAAPALPAPGKPGGVLNLVQREELTTGFAIHETATMGWSLDAFVHWPHVRNLVPHHGIYNWGRHTHVWLDK